MKLSVRNRRFSTSVFASWRLSANLLLLLATTIVCADEAAKTEPELNDSDREHWAYQTPKRAELPEVREAAWCRTSVDRFILAALEAAKLHPAAPAEAGVLLRRVTFDLTGLPPTPEEIAAFEKSCDYEAVVDRLLASRAYAERWAQHWLDVARYADSDGYEHDIARPEAWRYRDWVIDALDRDLPVDEFLRLQLAGDELRPNDPQAAVATGFLLCGPDMPDLNRQDERRSMVLNEMTGTVGSALLGLQVGCAQCHDHKFEPISQADFYRLRACFETSDFLSQARKEDDSEKDVTSETWRVFRTSKKVAEPSRLWVRGDFTRPGPTLDAGFPRVANLMNVSLTDSGAVAGSSGSALENPTTQKSTAGQAGNGTPRVRLAEWLTVPEHPLTARVFVNRVWQEHFGYGLVRTSNDFGYLGDSPTHPELLDWLAREFVDTGWSLKRLHRLIVTSAVYRQSSNTATDLTSSKIDPENLLLAHFPRRRLDGEAIRDAMLAASDGLSDRHGGPGVMPLLPKELLGTIRKDHWKTSKDEEDHRRRSIYLFVRRNLRLPLLEAFDRPDTMASCTRRNRSTIAPQALVLLNSEFAQECAAALAKYVGSQASQSERQVKLAYVRTLGREPTEVELREAKALVDADPAGIQDLCLALFNLNEFVYVD